MIRIKKNHSLIIEQMNIFVGTQTIIFSYTFKWSNRSIWPIDGSQTGATTPGQSGPGSNCNKGVAQVPQSYRTGAWPSDGLVSYPEQSFGKGS